MPAIFTHIQFGKEVARDLPPVLQSLIEAHPACFLLGTQGPDLLFYHKPMKKRSKNPARKKGWDLHALSPESFFLHGAKLLLSDERNRADGVFTPTTAEAAYLVGFLCHFTLDTTCHPLIDGNSVDGLTHGKIESELDKYHYRRLQMPVRGYNAAKNFYPSEEAAQAAARILEVSPTEAARAMKSMKKINGVFSSKCGFLHGFCHFALSLVGMNKSFGEMFLHKKEDPRCVPLFAPLQEKFDEARAKAATLIPTFFENIRSNVENGRLNDEIYRCNYSGITV